MMGLALATLFDWTWIYGPYWSSQSASSIDSADRDTISVGLDGKLLRYDFVIEYKTRASNVAADALSRRVEGEELSAFNIPAWLGVDDVVKELQWDSYIRGIIEIVKN